jgi:uncharacterized membrane protein
MIIFTCATIGFILGMMLGHFDDAVLAAIVGAVVGYCLKHKLAQPAAQSPTTPRSAAHGAPWVLETEMKAMRQQLDRIEQRLLSLSPVAEPPPVVVSEAAQAVVASELVEPIPAILEPMPAPEPEPVVVTSPLPEPVATIDVELPPAPPVAPVLPPNPTKPSLFSRAKDWLLGGNTVARVGMLLLFVGVVFLLRYAADHVHTPPELKLLGAALVGFVLTGLGWRIAKALDSANPEQHKQRRAMAWVLQGGGVAVLYLTVLAGFHFLHVYGFLPAMLMLAALSAAAVFLAYSQDSETLAIIGALGAFAAPVLLSTGQSNAVGLFTYLSIVNAVIGALAWRKRWAFLVSLGVAASTLIAWAWSKLRYDDSVRWVCEAYLLGHVALYIALGARFAIHSAQSVGRATQTVQASLVWGVPIVAFSMQARLFGDWQYALSVSAVVLGVVYLGLCRWARSKGEGFSLLSASYLALGLGFASLAIPLAFDAQWTSASWAIEGAGLLWVGLAQRQRLMRWAGLALQTLAVGAYLHLLLIENTPINSTWLSALLIALAAFISAYALFKTDAQAQARPSKIATLWGLLWWGFGLGLLSEKWHAQLKLTDSLLWYALASLSLLALCLLGSRLKWAALQRLGLLLLPLAIMEQLARLHHCGWQAGKFSSHPAATDGLLIGLLLFALAAWAQWRLPLTDKQGKSSFNWRSFAALALSCLALAIVSLELTYWVQQWTTAGRAWLAVAYVILPLLAAWQWPVIARCWREVSEFVARWGQAILFVYLLFWLITAGLGSSGDVRPMPYLPLLNIVDLAVIAILALVWQRNQADDTLWHSLSPAIKWALAGASFIVFNSIVQRALHHWADVPYQLDGLGHNAIAQVTYTLLWSSTASALMVHAHRRSERKIWLIGAALLGLVVVKLFFYDMASSGTLTRIISFMGAGGLMLVIGYFAPLPPKKDSA